MRHGLKDGWGIFKSQGKASRGPFHGRPRPSGKITKVGYDLATSEEGRQGSDSGHQAGLRSLAPEKKSNIASDLQRSPSSNVEGRAKTGKHGREKRSKRQRKHQAKGSENSGIDGKTWRVYGGTNDRNSTTLLENKRSPTPHKKKEAHRTQKNTWWGIGCAVGGGRGNAHRRNSLQYPTIENIGQVLPRNKNRQRSEKVLRKLTMCWVQEAKHLPR